MSVSGVEHRERVQAEAAQSKEGFRIPGVDIRITGKTVKRVGAVGLFGLVAFGSLEAVQWFRGLPAARRDAKLEGVLIANGWVEDTFDVTAGGKKLTLRCADNPETEPVEAHEYQFDLAVSGPDFEQMEAQVPTTTTDTNGTVLSQKIDRYNLRDSEQRTAFTSLVQVGCTALNAVETAE